MLFYGKQISRRSFFFRSVALFSSLIPIDKRGTRSACWVPFSKRSFRAEYESVSSRCSGELSKGITAFKTLDSQFCFQMRSISSAVQYVDLNFASLSWYLKKQRLLRLPEGKKARVKSPFRANCNRQSLHHAFRMQGTLGRSMSPCEVLWDRQG